MGTPRPWQGLALCKGSFSLYRELLLPSQQDGQKGMLTPFVL